MCAPFPSSPPPPASERRPVARADLLWAASEGMVQCGLPTVDGPCVDKAGVSCMAANADGVLQPACKHHAGQFAMPTRVPNAWVAAGYKRLSKDDQRLFWIQKASESALPPKNKNTSPEQNAPHKM